MKHILICAILFSLACGSSADTVPTLVFSGYIDYPAQHEYRIEIFTYPEGLISRVITFSGEPKIKHEEMVISKEKKQIKGVDQFQNNLKTLRMAVLNGSIDLVIENESLDTHKKTQAKKTIRIKPEGSVLFDDDAKKYSLLPTETFRIESKSDSKDAVVVRENQIFDDGWYRSDWKREGTTTTIREYTTMEVPGDWISDGGGVFSGVSLNTKDLITNIINYYILDIYLDRHIFIPWIFGLKTGSY